jgi:hypothetical protein
MAVSAADKSNAYWMVSVNHCSFRDHFREPTLWSSAKCGNRKPSRAILFVVNSGYRTR